MHCYYIHIVDNNTKVNILKFSRAQLNYITN